MYVPGYLGLLTKQVMCEEISQCYYNVNNLNFCFWTDSSHETQSAAQSACQRRNSFLPRITNSDIQSKLAEFRSASDVHNFLGGSGIWIGVKAVGPTHIH